MTRPTPRTITRCDHCKLPIVAQGREYVHDTPRRERFCIVDSRYTGTVAEPAREAS